MKPPIKDVEPSLQLALAHHQAGRVRDAEKIYREILSRKPNHLEALHLLGILAGQIGRSDAAVQLIQRAIQVKPDFAEAHSDLGNALKDMGQLDNAIAAYRQAVRLKPEIAEAHINLGNALMETGFLAEAIESYRHGIRLKPDFADIHSNLVFALHYHPDYDAGMIRQELRRWNERHVGRLRQFVKPHLNKRDSDRPLRIGYVSPDFCEHAVGRNLLPLFRNHDRKQFEIYCYSSTIREDALTKEFQQHSNQWRNTAGLSDAQVADLIRKDRIDILVDLSLHSANNRLLIFAYKPAPVQATYLGYCSTTGLETMDYRLSDPHFDPPDSDQSDYSEQTIRLPETYWCYSPGGPTPEPSPPPVESAGHITFGCLNNFSKVSPALDQWAEILQKVPGARLIIHSPPGAHLDKVRELFAGKGISLDRLEFPARQPWPEYVKTYGRIDIALDPFPWGGGITTCDALWMGVPVVTLVGKTAVGRGGASILANIGLPELIAKTPRQYVEIATSLTKDLPRLADLRLALRSRMQASPLMDSPRFARNIEAAYRQMWRSWCKTAP
jgi:predicted O-linked N-acetylglucosamine transferase (SPINDLY family)